MLSKLWARWRSKPDTPKPTDIIDRLNLATRSLTHEVIAQYSVQKAMSITLRISSNGPHELAEWVQNAGRVVDNTDYVPDLWKGAVRVGRQVVLDDFLTHHGYAVDFAQWYAALKPKLDRLLTGFAKLDDADREYYQRNYNSVLGDMDALLEGVLAACQ